ncbi:glycosyltransferase family 61 protein [Chryseobacterium sp.]|uniref:glycosyltransferase family 61 protein n=1 Tax=Chryseobacterium sp. TaxID=1871047 RepID=UPI00388E8FE6
MEAIIKRCLQFINNDSAISNYLIRFIFNIIYYRRSKIAKIKDYEFINGKELIEGSIFESFPPISGKCEVQKSIKTPTPDVKLFKFNNALIHADSSSILIGSNLLVNRYQDERYNEGFVKVHNQQYAKIKYDDVETISEGFFLGGNGSWNWYHYLIEILPKILLYEKLPSTILISDVVKKFPTMQAALDLLIGDNCKIIYLSRNKSYRVGELYYINNFNHLQFNRFDNQILGIGTYYNKKILTRFSDTLLRKINPDSRSDTKFFLYRKNTHRIAKNQEELKYFLEKEGFITICLEELTLEQQVSIFYNATFIVGISGAAWTNLIFCRNKAKAICFIPDNAKEFSAFSNLAKLSGVEFYGSYYKNEGNHISNNFDLDLFTFKQLYSQINEL